MNLNSQIKEIATRKINEKFANMFAAPTLAKELAVMAFLESWQESNDTVAIRRYLTLLNEHSVVSDEEPCVAFLKIEHDCVPCRGRGSFEAESQSIPGVMGRIFCRACNGTGKS
jgi:hypothetical protein